MASDDGEKRLYSNMDDDYDEWEDYLQPARKGLTGKRKPWSGYLTAPAPPAGTDSNEQQPSSSKPATLAVRDTTSAKADAAPQDSAETAISESAPLADEDNASEQVVSSTTKAADDVQSPPNPSGPAPLAGEDSGAAQASASSAPLAAASSEGAQDPVVISKQHRKAAALSKILGKDQRRLLQTPAPKKIIIKLKERQKLPEEPELPKRPPKPRQIVELDDARGVRTINGLIDATKRKYFEWIQKQTAGSNPPFFMSSEWKTKHKYGRVLWAEYCQLAPAIRVREAADKKTKTAAVTSKPKTSQLRSAIAAPLVEAKERHLDEWSKQFLQPSDSSAPAMSDAEARRAEASILADEPQEELDYEEDMPLVLAPPPKAPDLDEMMKDMSQLFKAPQKTPNPASVPGPFRK